MNKCNYVVSETETLKHTLTDTVDR